MKAPVQRDFGALKSDTRLLRAAPFLKWAGGKSQLLDQMMKHLPASFGTYYEPFLGGGAVFFRLRPARAILSDSNPELINVFRVVRDDPNPLMRALDKHHPHRRNKAYYYRLRDEVNVESLSAVDRAARSIFLNKTCYNGLYRVNARGQFNVPFGRYENPTLYDSESIAAASQALRGKIIDVGDYRDFCGYPSAGDFVYLDPPYQPLSPTASFTAYTKAPFDEENQKALSEIFRTLDKRGCVVMLSNSATDVVKNLYRDYRIEVLKATRPISSRVAGRGEIDEFLVMNYG